MITNKLKSNLPLILILIIAAFLRIYQLGSLPISLFGDEVDVGYHAYSLWTTHKDYTGHLLPTYIQSLAESRAPLLMYVSAPFVGILGPSAFSVRLPIALFGLISIFLLYLLTNLLIPKKIIDSKYLTISSGHISALFLTIAPWHIHYSRAAFEVTLLLSLLLLGTFWFLKWVETPKFINSLFLLPFVLTFYTYSTANLFTPLLLISLFVIYRPKISFKTFPGYLTPLILLIPITYQLLFGSAAGRFNLISIFNDPKFIDDEIVLIRTEPWTKPSIFETVFHNKPMAYLSIFGKQYLTPFSPQFLFLDGDPLFRQSTGHFGELPWLLAPLLILGIVGFLFSPTKNSRFLFFWLLISPIPSALTQGGGSHATRLFIMLPPLVIISTQGLISLLVFFRARRHYLYLPFMLGLILIFYTLSYWHNYSTHYKFESSRYWSYGYEQIFDQYKKLPHGNRFFINNTYEPSLLRFAFYTGLDPKVFQKKFTSDVSKDDIVTGFNGFKFGDDIYFGQLNPMSQMEDILEIDDYYLAVQLKEIPGDWDWTKNPPASISAIGNTKDVYGAPLFYLLQEK